MRFKSTLLGITRTRGIVVLPQSATSAFRAFATFAQPNPHNGILDITKKFSDDQGKPIYGAVLDNAAPGSPEPSVPPDPSIPNLNAFERNYDAFNAALNLSGTQQGNIVDEIRIPSGRYVFDRPIVMSNTVKKKTIKGDATLKSVYCPNLGYSLDCPSTIFDFSLCQASDINGKNLLSLKGKSKRLEPITKPINRGNTQYTFAQDHTLQNGDLLIITDPNDYSYGSRDYYRKGEYVTILKILNKKTIEIQTVDSYSQYTGGLTSCVFYKIIPLQINLENISIFDVNPKIRGNLRALNALDINYCANSNINNLFLIDPAHYAGLAISNAFNLNVNAGKYIIPIPDKSRVINNPGSNEYCIYKPENAYPISIACSQTINVDKVDTKSWWHAIATGGGTRPALPPAVPPNPSDTNTQDTPTALTIINRNISISNSTITSTPANLYYETDQDPNPALFKVAPANFHGNTEDSIFRNNTVIGSGINIGGHNNLLIENSIYTDNNREPTKRKFDYRHEDSAFYFNDAKSGKFLVQGNKVYINRFYQNPNLDLISYSNYRVGEFLSFSIDPASNTIWPGTSYKNGTLTIYDNQVVIRCYGEDQINEFHTGLLMIGGVPINEDFNKLCAKHVNEMPTDVNVMIANNTFSIFNNPAKSISLLTINPDRGGHLHQRRPGDIKINYWSRFKKIDIINNRFYGFFRVSINKSALFCGVENPTTPTDPCPAPQISKSDSVNISNNIFVSDNVTEKTVIECDPVRCPGAVLTNNTFTPY